MNFKKKAQDPAPPDSGTQLSIPPSPMPGYPPPQQGYPPPPGGYPQPQPGYPQQGYPQQGYPQQGVPGPAGNQPRDRQPKGCYGCVGLCIKKCLIACCEIKRPQFYYHRYIDGRGRVVNNVVQVDRSTGNVQGVTTYANQRRGFRRFRRPPENEPQGAVETSAPDT